MKAGMGIKVLFMIVGLMFITFLECYGQKFEVWINRRGNRWITGQLLVTGLKKLTGIVIVNGSKVCPGDFASAVAISPGCAMTGMLADHIFTTVQITIPCLPKEHN